jgi:hypothetical protein
MHEGLVTMAALWAANTLSHVAVIRPAEPRPTQMVLVHAAFARELSRQMQDET